MWIISILYMLTAQVLTTTAFVALLFYLIFLGTTTIILAFYFIRGYTTSTVIPCISSLWYKIYNGAIIAFALVFFIIACIETRRSPCGNYTSGQGLAADIMACGSEDTSVIDVGVPDLGALSDGTPGVGAFGVASIILNGTITSKPGEYWVYNFTGSCLGIPLYSSAQLVSPEPDD